MSRGHPELSRINRRASILKRKSNNYNVIEDAAKFIALISALGATIGVSFDVGYFAGLDISLFTLFSMGEHILFSLEITPRVIALSSVVICIGVLIFGLTRILRRLLLRGKLNFSKNRIRIIIGYVYIFILTTLVFVKYMFMINDTYFVTALFYILAISAAFIVDLSEKFFFGVVVVCTYGLVLWTTYLFGVRVSSKFFEPANSETIERDRNEIIWDHEIETKDFNVNKVKILRSGEKGVLLYNLDSGHVAYVFWENISNIKLRRKANASQVYKDTE